MRNIDGPPRRFTDPRRPPDACSAARCSAAPGGGFRDRVRRRAHADSSAQKQRATAQGLVDANGSAAGVAGGLIRPTERGGGAQPFNRGATLTVSWEVKRSIARMEITQEVSNYMNEFVIFFYNAGRMDCYQCVFRGKGAC